MVAAKKPRPSATRITSSIAMPFPRTGADLMGTGRNEGKTQINSSGPFARLKTRDTCHSRHMFSRRKQNRKYRNPIKTNCPEEVWRHGSLDAIAGGRRPSGCGCDL